jgi:hypothetical protein
MDLLRALFLYLSGVADPLSYLAFWYRELPPQKLVHTFGLTRIGLY